MEPIELNKSEVIVYNVRGPNVVHDGRGVTRHRYFNNMNAEIRSASVNCFGEQQTDFHCRQPRASSGRVQYRGNKLRTGRKYCDNSYTQNNPISINSTKYEESSENSCNLDLCGNSASADSTNEQNTVCMGKQQTAMGSKESDMYQSSCNGRSQLRYNKSRAGSRYCDNTYNYPQTNNASKFPVNSTKYEESFENSCYLDFCNNSASADSTDELKAVYLGEQQTAINYKESDMYQSSCNGRTRFRYKPRTGKYCDNTYNYPPDTHASKFPVNSTKYKESSENSCNIDSYDNSASAENKNEQNTSSWEEQQTAVDKGSDMYKSSFGLRGRFRDNKLKKGRKYIDNTYTQSNRVSANSNKCEESSENSCNLDLCDNSASSFNTDEQYASQRGKIVGGRYIRKQPNRSNKSIHSKELRMHNEMKDQNKQNYSNSNSSKNYYTNDQETVQLPSANQRRQFSYENRYHRNDYKQRTFDPAKEKLQISQRRTKENTSDCDSSSSNMKEQPSQFNHKRTVGNISDDSNLSLDIKNEPTAISKKSGNYRHASGKRLNYKENDDATQRELLIQRLTKGECECLVCCELIRVRDQTWHCLSCYHVFHLRCIRKWARSSAAVVDGGRWRCPACQSLSSKVPYDYYCFCGKHKNPDVNYHLTPHSCGEICGRKRANCSHLCKELCHPGPCPPCLIVVHKTCACGKTPITSPCNRVVEETCKNVCDKVLNCGLHRCENICHPGKCPSCTVTVSQKCFCGKSSRSVVCTLESAKCVDFSCGEVCEKSLNCGNHICDSICHPGICNPCSFSIEVIKTCCCGKSTIESLVASGKTAERSSCKDPIPLCGEICEKPLFCGPKDNPHKCQSTCHEGECPPCPLKTSLKCRCGAFTKEFECATINPSFLYLCEKRCNRRKDCGRHKCLNNCCINIEHRCDLICNKKLSCGLHNCQETCHMGNCPQCGNVSFEELRCHCGFSVTYPPIHCGTKPPECPKPCTRSHSCEHDVKHTCHSDETCPPCTSLTVKWCYGKHKQCGTVMCFLDGVSCGMPCNKTLPCGVHKCQLTCHPGQCLKPDAKCTQPCSIPRPNCGHPCGNPCHEGLCPETPCKAQVTLNCPCGRRSETSTCYDSAKSYRLISGTVLASKMQEIKDGQCVNLNDVLGKKSKNGRLQCNEECAVIERNKRLAVALQIQNPDLSCSPGPPNYSEFLKDEAKKNPAFVSGVYDKITELVQLAKSSKQKYRSHSFPPMNRDQRRVVHELAEFFGCETQSYDEEPKKNVVVTAYKTKCYLPFASIMTVVQRDMGIRKGPTPILARDIKALPSTNVYSGAQSQKKKIDYFDFTE
ncbi:transcriptional repressor NF-X1-like [Stegodyphus dumicola]|uniref:transcriptional repressor NF-X1-like n=1 Tax=Stegodyphus dumicola TaxID=202533 RepID=UPI0015B21FFA|nr:transcriptional repressor NF-X1-like [Stegodyphus dumicola]XP_035208184.1 transcriptional repressor NF-X1-like [Stegodyphus dumicola]